MEKEVMNHLSRLVFAFVVMGVCHIQSAFSAPVPITTITAGSYHTCALTGYGVVKCWGNNSSGALGSNSYGFTPEDVAGLDGGVMTIVAGDQYTCALANADGVKCWGFNVYGQLGNGIRTIQFSKLGMLGMAMQRIEILQCL
jgi:alpha-tubulin suppressor-like RCC1 family protein